MGMTVFGPKRASMYEHQCRNGHKRTAQNTYTRAGGMRQCKDCPGWQRAQLSAQQRSGGQRDATERAAPRYHRVLSAAELGYLRSLIPCAGCSAPFGAEHQAECWVPYNREGDGTEASSPRKKAA